MLKHLPVQKYNGLTIVLSQPSRRDTDYLISGYAGIMFEEFLQENNTSRFACDIRLAEDRSPLLSDTKGILLLGEKALKDWCPKYSDYTINEVRGTPLDNPFDLPVICSYTPQDACDLQDFEGKFNPHLSIEDDDAEKIDDSGEDSKRRGGFTQRKNFRFWLNRDVNKILYRISNKPIFDTSKYEIRIYPRADEIISAFKGRVGEYLYFDIETDSERNITVIGFSFSSSNTIYSFPVFDYNYSLYYRNDLYRILHFLCVALRDNTVVIHNSMFDLFVLLFKYRLLIGKKVYDTMLAQHRIFPGVEKSLGHCLSCYPQIWLPYHKDEAIFEPKNHNQERTLLYYNAKDIVALRVLKEAQDMECCNDPGLIASIAQANSMPYPFLLNTLKGIRVDKEEIEHQLAINARLLDQLLRVCRILTGDKVNLLPSSSQSCVKYFHEMLGYPVVGKSKKTGEVSLDETNLIKLKQKNPMNILIDICIKYRGLKKFSGSLKAQPLGGWHE